jgi:hypothetical protein
MSEQIGRILIDAIRTGAIEFVFAVAAGKETDAQGAGATRGKQVPDAVAHDDRILDGNLQAGGRGKKRSGSGLARATWSRVTMGTLGPTPRPLAEARAPS